MTRDKAINYLICSGMSQEQINIIINAIESDELKAYREAMTYLLTARPGGYPLHKWTSEYGYVITVDDIINIYKDLLVKREG